VFCAGDDRRFSSSKKVADTKEREPSPFKEPTTTRGSKFSEHPRMKPNSEQTKAKKNSKREKSPVLMFHVFSQISDFRFERFLLSFRAHIVFFTREL
jgi:hypothetical protein